METVRVDMQKLQLLNERIAQTIEALNQVRLSVHGIQHTPASIGWNPPPTAGYPFGSYGFGLYGSVPYGQPFASYGTPPYVPGFQHTTSPVPTTSWPNPTWFSPQFSNGLSHSTWEPPRFAPTIY
jgi:hypothetical protein